MMKKYYIQIIMMFLFTIHPKTVKAQIYTCDYKEKARLTAIASNITTSVDYKEKNNKIEFIVTITNLHPDIYIKDVNNNIDYKYNKKSSNPKELVLKGYKDNQNIKYEIYSVKRLCKNDILTSKYVVTPPYNKYYNDPLCKIHSTHRLCRKWIKNNYDYKTFKKELETKEIKAPIEEEVEEEKDFLTKVVMFLMEYYIYISACVIIIVSGAIYVFRIKKGDFDL